MFNKYSENIKSLIDIYIDDKFLKEKYLIGEKEYNNEEINNIEIDLPNDELNILKENLKVINDIFEKKELLGIDEITSNRIERIKKKYKDIFDVFFNDLKDENFTLEEQIINDKIIGTYIKCNTKFDKIYSDYAVEKSIQNKDISEGLDKIKIRMLSMKILSNLISKANMQYKYILYLHKAIYYDEDKFISFIELINDHYSQNKIILGINYNTLLERKDMIKKYRQEGYKFIVEMNDIDFKNIDTESLLYCEYIFVKTDNENIYEYYNYIPFNMYDKLYLTKQTILYEEMT